MTQTGWVTKIVFFIWGGGGCTRRRRVREWGGGRRKPTGEGLTAPGKEGG